MSARFTEAEAASVDALCAGMTRAEYVRRAVLAMTRKGQAAVAAQLALEGRHAAESRPRDTQP